MDPRITIVLDVWDPDRGGLEAYAAQLVQALVIAGREVEVLCGEARARVPAGAALVESKTRGRAFYRDVDARAAARAHGFLVSFRHPGATANAFLPLGGLLVSSLAARRRAEPGWLAIPKRIARALSGKTRFFLARERAFFATGRPVLASSTLVRDEIRARFPHYAGPLEVLGLPVDAGRFTIPTDAERAASRRRFELDPEDVCVLWIGNDPIRKGLRAARHVLERLRARKIAAHLVLAGHGTERWDGMHRGLIGLGHVDFVPALMHACDVLLLPSVEDNLSFAVLEALASGLPVVTTRHNGASSYLVERDIGRVVDDAADVEALDRATLAMLDGDLHTDAVQARRRAAVESCFGPAHFGRLVDCIDELRYRDWD